MVDTNVPKYEPKLFALKLEDADSAVSIAEGSFLIPHENPTTEGQLLFELRSDNHFVIAVASRGLFEAQATQTVYLGCRRIEHLWRTEPTVIQVSDHGLTPTQGGEAHQGLRPSRDVVLLTSPQVWRSWFASDPYANQKPIVFFRERERAGRA